MNKLLNIKKTELHDQLTLNLEIELERLTYFEASLKVIRVDTANKGNSVRNLAKLGEYLTRVFIPTLLNSRELILKDKISLILHSLAMGVLLILFILSLTNEANWLRTAIKGVL